MNTNCPTKESMPDGVKKKFWTTDRIMWLIISCVIAAGLICLILYLSDVLLPFFAACLISYLLNPIVEFFMTKVRVRKRLLAVLLTVGSVTVVVGGIVYLCAPMVAKEIDTLSDMVKHYSGHPDYLHFLSFLPPSWVDAIRNFDTASIVQMLDMSHISAVFSKGTSLVTWSIESLMHVLEWLLMFIYIIFILLDYEQIVRGFKKIFPQRIRPQAMSVVADVEREMNSYFRGQGFVALCACVLYTIGFYIVGLPLAIVMGLLVGILYMIPYFQYITLIPVLIICFITSLDGHVAFWTIFGKCLLVYGVVQSICDYVITPHVMGKEMGLNPAVILLSLSIWGSLLGIIGMIIALPVTALILAYYERYISNR